MKHGAGSRILELSNMYTVIHNQNILVPVPKVPVHWYQYQNILSYFPKYDMDDHQNILGFPKIFRSNLKISLKDFFYFGTDTKIFSAWARIVLVNQE